MEESTYFVEMYSTLEDLLIIGCKLTKICHLFYFCHTSKFCGQNGGICQEPKANVHTYCTHVV